MFSAWGPGAHRLLVSIYSPAYVAIEAAWKEKGTARKKAGEHCKKGGRG